MSRPLSRPAALLPVSAMQTYRISSPPTTHRRPATCAEVECEGWKHGWVTVVPVGSEQEITVRRGADGRIDGVRRYFSETRAGDGLIEFRFKPGQACWRQAKHTVSLQRPENFLVRGGDWRGSTGLIRRHTQPELWVEDFAENLDKVRRRAGA